MEAQSPPHQGQVVQAGALLGVQGQVRQVQEERFLRAVLELHLDGFRAVPH